MKIVFKKLLSLFGYWPYRFALFAAKSVFKRAGHPAKIWARNSFALKTLEPGFSDLDLTLVFKNRTPYSTVSSVFQAAEYFRNFCPLLGELNIYREKPGAEFFKFHNFFELNRDPLLSELSKIQRIPNSVEAAVFLLRQLEKDIKQIDKFPEKRIKKWTSHFVTIDRYIPNLELQTSFPIAPENLLAGIQSAILKCLGVAHDIMFSDVNDKLSLYLEMIRCEVDIGKTRAILVNNSWWLVFSIPKTASISIPPVKLTDIQMRFFEAQISWELCSSLSQTSVENRLQVVAHFENLKNLLARQRAFQSSGELANVDNLVNEVQRSLN